MTGTTVLCNILWFTKHWLSRFWSPAWRRPSRCSVWLSRAAGCGWVGACCCWWCIARTRQDGHAVVSLLSACHLQCRLLQAGGSKLLRNPPFNRVVDVKSMLVPYHRERYMDALFCGSLSPVLSQRCTAQGNGWYTLYTPRMHVANSPRTQSLCRH